MADSRLRAGNVQDNPGTLCYQKTRKLPKTPVESKKIVQMNVYAKQKQTWDIENKLVLPKDRGKGEGQIKGIELADTNCYV